MQIVSDKNSISERIPMEVGYDGNTILLYGSYISCVHQATDVNEFLSRFICFACGKRCLLTLPRCSKGQGNQEKAIVIYQEMFSEVEL